MYEASEVYKDYLTCARSYDTDISPQACMAQHERWAAELPCTVLRADGTNPISENADWIVEQYLQIISNE